MSQKIKSHTNILFFLIKVLFTIFAIVIFYLLIRFATLSHTDNNSFYYVPFTNTVPVAKLKNNYDVNYTIVVFDGCEYIVTHGRSTAMTHKGNCTNSIHIYNK